MVVLHKNVCFHFFSHNSEESKQLECIKKAIVLKSENKTSTSQIIPNETEQARRGLWGRKTMQNTGRAFNWPEFHGMVVSGHNHMLHINQVDSVNKEHGGDRRRKKKKKPSLISSPFFLENKTTSNITTD